MAVAAVELPGGASLWDRMVLTPSDWGPIDQESAPPGVILGLRAIETAAVVTAGDCRATPSAGAIYPYEFYVIAGRDDAVVLAVDPVRRLCRRVATSARAVAEQCRQAGVEAPDGGALVVLVTRPWLSMRKYDDRGYLYTQLDAAHVAVNALGLAGAHGELRTRFTAGPLERLLGVEGRCREIHSVLLLAPAAGDPVVEGWTIRHPLPGIPAPGASEPSWLELICWQSLRPLLAGGRGEPHPGRAPLTRPGETFDLPAGTLPTSLASRPLRAQQASTAPPGPRASPAPAPVPPSAPELPESQWAALSRRRTSSKQYAPADVPSSVVARVLTMAGVPLRTDLPHGGELHMTLLARTVFGLRPGFHRLPGGVLPRTAAGSTGGTVADGAVLDGTKPAVSAPSDPPSGDDIVRACVHQKHLRDAAAFILFHAPRADLVADRSAQLRELLFRAGGIAQLLYLGAADAGLGVTAVGGFDADLWREFTRLPEEHDPVYLLSFGVPGAGTVKWDRLATPYARDRR